MENQHRQIKGYRELNESEIALMNEMAIIPLTNAKGGPTMAVRDRLGPGSPVYLAGFLARLAAGLGFGACGVGGVFNIRRSTSSSGAGVGLVMVGCRHG